MVNNKDIPLSNIDIERLAKDIGIKKLNWMRSTDIHKNMSVEDLFKHTGHVVLWHPWNGFDGSNGAHWIILLRNKNKEVFYFDSYGKDNPIFKFDELREILKGHRFFANDVKFQNDKSAVCGRYCCLALALNKIFNGDFDRIDSFLKIFKKESKNVDAELLRLVYG